MRIAFAHLLIVLATPALSGPFAAAGRIENAESGASCSAALIRADVIVTAAHCVRSAATSSYVFRLGDGKPTEPFPVGQVIRHPFYDDFSDQRVRRLRFDIAVAKLERPVPAEDAQPFAVADDAQTGEGLFLASWRGDGTSRPRQRRCLVLDGEVPGVVTLGCRVLGGESGAPVLRLTEDGMELVAILNSQSRLGVQPVGLAADVRLRIPPLLDRLQETP